DAKPYKLEELIMARNFIAALEGKNCSQADLEAAMEHAMKQYQRVPQRNPDYFSSFLESGCYAMSQAYRDTMGFTTPAVLDTEISAWQATKRAGKPTDGFVVPVPKRFASPRTVLGSLLSVAPASHYHPDFGFLDRPAS